MFDHYYFISILIIIYFLQFEKKNYMYYLRISIKSKKKNTKQMYRKWLLVKRYWFSRQWLIRSNLLVRDTKTFNFSLMGWDGLDMCSVRKELIFFHTINIHMYIEYTFTDNNNFFHTNHHLNAIYGQSVLFCRNNYHLWDWFGLGLYL